MLTSDISGLLKVLEGLRTGLKTMAGLRDRESVVWGEGVVGRGECGGGGGDI